MAEVVGNGAVTATARRQGEGYWREQVAAWKGSGLSQLEFCKERGLSRFGFGKWKVRLEGAGPRGGARFVRVGSAKVGAAARRAILLTVGGRYALEIAEGFDGPTLGASLKSWKVDSGDGTEVGGPGGVLGPGADGHEKADQLVGGRRARDPGAESVWAASYLRSAIDGGR